MIITEVIEISSNKLKIQTDEEITLVLYKGDFYKNHFDVGKEIPQKYYEELITSILPHRAWLRCMKLFQSKDYTEKEIRDKLQKDGYSKEIRDHVIERLYETRFLNDEYYAGCYIENRVNKKSKREIIRELSLKGIPDALSERLFEEYEAQGNTEFERNCIENILRKKKYNGETASFEEKMKMKNYLLRKGFQTDYVNDCILNNYCQ
ncbi:MAG: regulatory protein RecX [Lachnospiraceae bacterium]|nr:regulatory protein RecX [Lachnospiraceae bacterium]